MFKPDSYDLFECEWGIGVYRNGVLAAYVDHGEGLEALPTGVPITVSVHFAHDSMLQEYVEDRSCFPVEIEEALQLAAEEYKYE